MPGDDFVAVGRRIGFDKLQATLESAYEIKAERLGWSKGRQREGRVLGRVIRLAAEGATLESDPALLEEAVHRLGLRG